MALLGPSGAGKSTLIQGTAGLLRADHVRVELDGMALHALAPERRRLGVVFQDGRLFPHLNVRANLRYGLLRARHGPIAFDDVVDLLGLSTLLPRRPATLSGGERQRVAIGRALLSQPRLLLMDEPLAALDQPRRHEILPYLARLRATGIPIVYASHALDEVMRLADTLVLIEAGRRRAPGPLAEIAARVDLGIAAREDACGLLLGRVAHHDPARRLTAIACAAGPVWVPLMSASPATRVRLLVPAREVILALESPQAISVNNILPATVVALAESAASHAALVSLDLAGDRLPTRITLDAARRLQLRPGTQVLALIKSMSVELCED